MSLLGRLLGRRPGDPYAEGIALYESGRFAQAIARLRVAAQDPPHSAAGSLAAFHLRQALVNEGKRLLTTGQPEAAVPLLDEAVADWDTYPDLHFLFGLAQGLTGDWSGALGGARRALRLNGDYCEARLLEACALTQVERSTEAADSLNKLLELGRRTDHPLIAKLAGPGQYHSHDLPHDLPVLLTDALAAPSRERETAGAVARCRAGQWDEGLARFRDLVRENPDYPDLRVKLAAALFQVGRGEEALDQVRQALVLNPQYRTATCLQALILADLSHLESAWRLLSAAQPAELTHPRHGHEGLFGAYLEGVLALLTGRLNEVEEILAQWTGLTQALPRAELLRAAVADLSGRGSLALERLAALAAAWPGENDFAYYHACQLLEMSAGRELERVLARWPVVTSEADDRSLRLSARLALIQGQMPQELPPGREESLPECWRIILAEVYALQGRWQECLAVVQKLADGGLQTEETVHMSARAALHIADADLLPSDWKPTAVLPEALIPSVTFLFYRQERNEEAEQLMAPHGRLRPEVMRWSYLRPDFWLDPIRGWIA